MVGRQLQSAGENAQQIQVAGDFIFGDTEQRAAEIAADVAREVVAQYTIEASDIASARVSAFDARLVTHMESLELLEAFRDPAFQMLLRKAQIGAASTDREEDYDLLARLLSERAQQQERRHKASIARAVEVVASWMTTHSLA